MSAHPSSSTPPTSIPKVQGPYTAIPNGLLLAEGLPAPAKVIAGQLATVGWRTGYVTQTIPYLARCCRVAVRTLEKWVSVLKSWGLVRSISDQDAPSGRRLYLTWLSDPYAKSADEPIEDRMNVQGHAQTPLRETRDRDETVKPEKEEADLRPRPEAETPTMTPVVEEIVPEAAQEGHHAHVEPVDVPSVQDDQKAAIEASATSCLTAEETDRLAQLSDGMRAEVIELLATGAPVLIKEARSRLRPVLAARSEPQTTEELVRRVHERPDYVPKLASALQQGTHDTAPKQWHFWVKVARTVASRVVAPDEVLRILAYAARTPKPANYFARSWAKLGI